MRKNAMTYGRSLIIHQEETLVTAQQKEKVIKNMKMENRIKINAQKKKSIKCNKCDNMLHTSNTVL